jgi:hypothetical protein
MLKLLAYSLKIIFFFERELYFMTSNMGLVMWDLWWTKWRWGRFPPVTSVSPANLHFTNFSTITNTYHRGWYNRPVVAAVPEVPQHKLKEKITCILHDSNQTFATFNS